MSAKPIDWSLFESIEQVVSELMKRQMYNPVHGPISQITRESEDVIACLDQLNILLHFMANEIGRSNLPDTWNVNPEGQVEELQKAYDELLAVVTTILPQQALELLRDRMH